MTARLSDERPMTPERLAEIAARCEAATPGPMFTRKAKEPVDGAYDCAIAVDGVRPEVIAECYGRTDYNHYPDAEANATFFAHARTDVPDLHAEVLRLQALLREAKAALDNWEAMRLVIVNAVKKAEPTWVNDLEFVIEHHQRFRTAARVHASIGE